MRRWTRIPSIGSTLATAGALLIIASAAGLGFGPVPAGAAGTAGSPYQLKATGVGLKLGIDGITLVAATSSALAGNTTAPVGSGSGTLTPLAVSNQQATVGTPGTTQQLAQVCALPPDPFPAPISSLLTLGVGCSSASAAEGANGTQSASGSGQLATVTIGFTPGALTLPVNVGSTVASGLQGVLGTLPAIPVGGLSVGTVLKLAAQKAGSTITSLLRLQIGTSTSTVTTSATSATAKSDVAGATLSLLNGLGSGGGPLLTVTVLSATATSVLNRITGEVTSHDTPAALTVTVSPPIGTPQTVSIGSGQSQSFLTGTPLQTTVSAGSGTQTSGVGHGGSTAQTASIRTAQGLGTGSAPGGVGGLEIDLGSVSDTASGTAPQAILAATTVPGATTVHTGKFWAGSVPPTLFLLAMFIGTYLISRRRVNSWIHHALQFARSADRSAGNSPPNRIPETPSRSTSVSNPVGRRPGGLRTAILGERGSTMRGSGRDE